MLLDIYGGLTGMRLAGGMAGCWKGDSARCPAGQAVQGGRARAAGPGCTRQDGRARADEQSRRARVDGPGLAGQGDKRNDSKALVKQYNNMVTKNQTGYFPRLTKCWKIMVSYFC